MTTAVLDRHTPGTLRSDRGRPPHGGGGGDPRPGDENAAQNARAETARVGLLAFMATVTMLFIGFSSALLLRRASPDWQPLRAPSLLYASSAALLLSSLTLAIARRRLLAWDLVGSERYTWATGLLGASFVGAQLGAWRQLAQAGVFLATNPSSSFFYVLTGVHIVHLLGGLAWFSVVAARLRKMSFAPGEDGLGLFATYWHFLGGLWIYLLFLVFGLGGR